MQPDGSRGSFQHGILSTEPTCPPRHGGFYGGCDDKVNQIQNQFSQSQNSKAISTMLQMGMYSSRTTKPMLVNRSPSRLNSQTLPPSSLQPHLQPPRALRVLTIAQPSIIPSLEQSLPRLLRRTSLLHQLRARQIERCRRRHAHIIIHIKPESISRTRCFGRLVDSIPGGWSIEFLCPGCGWCAWFFAG